MGDGLAKRLDDVAFHMIGEEAAILAEQNNLSEELKAVFASPYVRMWFYRHPTPGRWFYNVISAGKDKGETQDFGLDFVVCLKAAFQAHLQVANLGTTTNGDQTGKVGP